MSETFVWQLVDLYTQKVINVFRPRLVIGRSKEADILCTAISASRSHAEFTLTEDGCLAISDLKVQWRMFLLLVFIGLVAFTIM